MKWWLTALMLLAIAALPAQEVHDVDDDFRLTPDSILLQPDTTLFDTPRLIQADTIAIDSTSLRQLSDSLYVVAQRALQPAFQPDPIRALWLSLILPGAGQIYNHKYWKLPIVYGGFLGCAYALTWNNQMLKDYSQAYLDIMDDDPNSKSYEKMLPIGYNISGREEQFKEIFKNKKNYYRKYRDMSIFAFVAVYAIAAIDAYVDAELSSFDISEDLSLHVAPAVISSRPESPVYPQGSVTPNSGVGMALRLNF